MNVASAKEPFERQEPRVLRSSVVPTNPLEPRRVCGVAVQDVKPLNPRAKKRLQAGRRQGTPKRGVAPGVTPRRDVRVRFVQSGQRSRGRLAKLRRHPKQKDKRLRQPSE